MGLHQRPGLWKNVNISTVIQAQVSGHDIAVPQGAVRHIFDLIIDWPKLSVIVHPTRSFFSEGVVVPSWMSQKPESRRATEGDNGYKRFLTVWLLLTRTGQLLYKYTLTIRPILGLYQNQTLTMFRRSLREYYYLRRPWHSVTLIWRWWIPWSSSRLLCKLDHFWLRTIHLPTTVTVNNLP